MRSKMRQDAGLPGPDDTDPAVPSGARANAADDELAFEEMENSKTRALIEARMPQRSWAQLERVTGLDQLPRRLSQAQRQHNIPLDVLMAIHRATDITVAELVMAFFEDAGYPLPYQIDGEMVDKFLTAAPTEQALLTALLDWLRYNAGHQ